MYFTFFLSEADINNDWKLWKFDVDYTDKIGIDLNCNLFDSWKVWRLTRTLIVVLEAPKHFFSYTHQQYKMYIVNELGRGAI